MVTLDTIFEDLQYGELFNTVLGGEDMPDKVILSTDYKQVGSYINRALIALYTRFPLKYKEIVIQQYEDITKYYLRYAYAYSNTESLQETRYLIDTIDDPFLDDILKIEEVFNEMGEKLSVNDGSDENSVYTPEQDCLQFSSSDLSNDNSIFVTYRAKHPKISLNYLMTTEDLEKIEIDIPDTLVTALLYYVGSRYYGSIAISNETHDSITYSQMYEIECSKVEQAGIIQSDSFNNDPIESNGWV